MAAKFTPAEKDQLVTAFEALDVKPKMDDPESLKKWMSDYLEGVRRTDGHDPDEESSRYPVQKTHFLHSPRISIFSGDEEKDSSFEAWKFEVLTLAKEGTSSEKVIATALKKSLRGDAAKVVRRLGLNASIEDILNKFEGIFGTVEDPECLLSAFYSAEQHHNEKVATWGCRLEDLLDRALQDQTVSSKSIDDMLKVKFWSGLQDHIKEGTRHLKDTVRNFDELRVQARKVERERSSSTHKDEPQKLKKSGQIKLMSADCEKSKLEKMEGEMCQLNAKVSELHSLMMSKAPSQQLPESQKMSNAGQSRGTWNNNRNYRGRGHYRGGSNRGQHWNRNQNATTDKQFGSGTNTRPVPQDVVSSQPHTEIICHRCKRAGHIAIGCRADLSQLHLNRDESV